MIEVFMYQAECGNAARIRFMGTDEKIHNVFVDGGVEPTYNHVLKDQIAEIISNQEDIDLFIVTHIHDDHIGGAISYLNDISEGITTDVVKSWYYNPPRFTDQQTRSIAQGDQLFEYVTNLGTSQKGDITNETEQQNFFGLKINFLSPNAEKLILLRQKYLSDIPFETRELLPPIVDERYDYHILIEDFKLDKWREDRSVENGSSIAMITEYNNLRILWLADSHPTVVVASLRKLGFSKENPLVCDWVKVTHHGSKANNNNELYDLIRCDNYILSVDGENKHRLPTKECIARILRNSNRPTNSHYHLLFTYDHPVLKSIFNADGPQVFEKWNFTPHFLSEGKWISIVKEDV